MTAQKEDPRVGQVLLGKLQVLRRIGGGGMGDVYEVEHLLTRHRRALKIVRVDAGQQRRFMERFLREVSVAGRLGTPFVVETFDAGWLEDESAYVLMELLAGRSLQALLEDDGMLSARRAAMLMCQVAEGVQVAHDASIVHRDLKPENLFVTKTEDGRERVKILDFGVSKFLDVAEEKATKLTREGSSVGTPYYMSPEQAAGKDVDGRCDVWAMGVVLYELLTGRLPFEGETVGEVLLKIGGGMYVPLEHRRPDVDPVFIAVVERALEPDLGKRYPTAEALRRDLLPFAGGESAARAKTISDGPRSAPQLPAPGAVAAVTMDGPVRDRMGVRTPRSSPPATVSPSVAAAALPEAPPSTTKRAMAAAALLVLVTLISLAVVWGEGGRQESRATERVPSPEVTSPPSEPSEPSEPSVEHVAIEPPVVAPEEPPLGPPPSPGTLRSPRTRAEAAGLEDDPYGP